MKGIAAKLKGTIAARVPIDVPTKSRVKGITAIINIINGIERVMLTKAASVL